MNTCWRCGTEIDVGETTCECCRDEGFTLPTEAMKEDYREQMIGEGKA